MINYINYNKRSSFGPFVYRLGHMVFIIEIVFLVPFVHHYLMFFVYLIFSKFKKKTISYVGYTNNLKKRLVLHNSSKGAKFTRGKKWKLVYFKKYDKKKIAMKEEYKFKKNYILRNKIKLGKKI